MAPRYPQPLDLASLAPYMGRRFSNVVYGLIDPRQPGVAYVGRSKGHVLLRYFQHITDGLVANGQRCTKRMRWLAEIRALRLQPGLTLIETVNEDVARLVDRESYWIAEHKSRREAWINDMSEIQWVHRRWLDEQLGAA